MKRFTETTKWRDPWFRRLSPVAKLLWLYLIDNCSCIGLIEIDPDAAEFDIGHKIGEKHMTELGDRIQALGDGKYFIPKFIRFQYGELSETCPAHKPVFKSISQHKLVRDSIDYKYPMDRVNGSLQERKGMDKEKEEGVQREAEQGEYHKDSRTVLYLLREATGIKFREMDCNLSFISKRLGEPEVTLDGVKMMIHRQVKLWKGTEMAEYLRPETLFNKTKFESYYAMREAPTTPTKSANQKFDPSVQSVDHYLNAIEKL